MDWRLYLQILLGTALGAAIAVAAVIIVADPYQNVPLSPAFARAPVDTNQRFAFPALARNPAFDSVILGTSTVRLLNPTHLDTLLGARFANLAMNSATAWEQSRIGHLFLRSRARTRFLVVGIDTVWCGTGPGFERYTFRLFPEWMYDDNRWNDLLYLFNDKALEQAVREIEYLRGRREAKYRRDGYRDFLPSDERYDLAKARVKIYGDASGASPAPQPLPAVAPVAVDPGIVYPTHALLDELFIAAGPDSTKILLFVPYHVQLLRASAAQYSACKGRLIQLSARHPNTHLVDFMIPSSVTTEDRNYWDPLHYTRAVARSLERHLVSAIRQQRDEPGVYAYLTAAALAREASP